MKTRQTSLIPILSVNFIGTLGYSIVMPFLIFLVTRFGGNAVIFGLVIGGILYSLFASTSFIIAATVFMLVFVLALWLPGNPAQQPTAKP